MPDTIRGFGAFLSVCFLGVLAVSLEYAARGAMNVSHGWVSVSVGLQSWAEKLWDCVFSMGVWD